jgi:hypothetical protein
MLNDLFHTLCKTVFSILALTTANPEYLISTKGSRRPWTSAEDAIHLHDTWSYSHFCWESVLPYTRICRCFWVMITLNTCVIFAIQLPLYVISSYTHIFLFKMYDFSTFTHFPHKKLESRLFDIINNSSLTKMVKENIHI